MAFPSWWPLLPDRVCADLSLLLSRAVSAKTLLFQHSSYSESVTQYFTVILIAAPPPQRASLAVSRCDSSSAGSSARCVTSSQRIHSEAAHHTPSHRIRLAELRSYTRRTYPPALLKACSPESTQLPIAVRGLGIPGTTVSQQPIAIRMVELSRHVGISTSRADCLASLL